MAEQPKKRMRGTGLGLLTLASGLALAGPLPLLTQAPGKLHDAARMVSSLQAAPKGADPAQYISAVLGTPCEEWLANAAHDLSARREEALRLADATGASVGVGARAGWNTADTDKSSAYLELAVDFKQRQAAQLLALAEQALAERDRIDLARVQPRETQICWHTRLVSDWAAWRLAELERGIAVVDRVLDTYREGRAAGVTDWSTVLSFEQSAARMRQAMSALSTLTPLADSASADYPYPVTAELTPVLHAIETAHSTEVWGLEQAAIRLRSEADRLPSMQGYVRAREDFTAGTLGAEIGVSVRISLDTPNDGRAKQIGADLKRRLALRADREEAIRRHAEFQATTDGLVKLHHQKARVEERLRQAFAGLDLRPVAGQDPDFLAQALTDWMELRHAWLDALQQHFFQLARLWSLAGGVPPSGLSPLDLPDLSQRGRPGTQTWLLPNSTLLRVKPAELVHQMRASAVTGVAVPSGVTNEWETELRRAGYAPLRWVVVKPGGQAVSPAGGLVLDARNWPARQACAGITPVLQRLVSGAKPGNATVLLPLRCATLKPALERDIGNVVFLRTCGDPLPYSPVTALAPGPATESKCVVGAFQGGARHVFTELGP